MKSFKDSEGREWNLSLNIGTVKRLRDSSLKLDLLAVEETGPDQQPVILRLITDVILLCDVLFVLCSTQAEKLGISDEQFGMALGGKALLDGQEALFAELTDFFQSLGRTEKGTIVTKAAALMKASVTAATAKAQALDVETLAATVVGNSFTNAQASLDRLLINTPSESLSG